MHPLFLSLAYVLPIAFLIWLWVVKRPETKTKIILTLLLPLLYALHWQGILQLKGWPADTQLPEKFELLSADIIEPETTENSRGNIHLWIRPDTSNDTGKPRAYTLPYTRELHKALFETKQRAAQGRRQIGLLYNDESGGKGASLGNGRRLDFQDAPLTRLPPKI